MAPVNSVRLPTAPSNCPLSPGFAKFAITLCTAGRHMQPILVMNILNIKPTGVGASPAPKSPAAKKRVPVRIAFSNPK